MLPSIKFKIMKTKSKDICLFICNMTGTLLKTITINQKGTGNSLNIQHISPGVYLLKAETDAGIKTEKLVVH